MRYSEYTDGKFTIADIEEIICEKYGVESDYDYESGCYKNGDWFSVVDILNELVEHEDEY